MSSTANNKTKFSIEDFEKGLVLLGLLSPSTLQEKEDMEALEEFEKSHPAKKTNIYFKRAVLAAEIVSQMHEERTFGRIKFQKLMYLCEYISEMKLTERYAKQAAGPFDNKFMHSIDKEFMKQRWFNVEKINDGNFTVTKYSPMDNSMGYKNYYQNYFSGHEEHIQFILDLFRNKKTEETELAATVLACVLELSAESNNINWKDLFEAFYNWHDKKKRFTQSQIITSFTWLKENNLLPSITIV